MLVAQANFESPLFWAVLIGWILSVVLHEFGHGLVAWWGGDYTIKERGGLTLNPLQYVDPLMSIILPALFVAMGGIPLPGGATYVRHDLLRSKWWESAVSLAGPAMNVLVFFACVLPLHPAFGWVEPYSDAQEWTNAQLFLGATAVLQVFAVLLNLIPLPPLDGFNAISPALPDELRQRLMTPPLSTIAFVMVFAVIWGGGAYVFRILMAVLETVLGGLGYGLMWIELIRAFRIALFGVSAD